MAEERTDAGEPTMRVPRDRLWWVIENEEPGSVAYTIACATLFLDDRLASIEAKLERDLEIVVDGPPTAEEVAAFMDDAASDPLNHANVLRRLGEQSYGRPSGPSKPLDPNRTEPHEP